MSLTDDKVLKFMCGLPIIYQDVCTVRSPLLKDIAAEGLSKFYQYISILTIQKPSLDNPELKKLLSPLTDFEYLLLLIEMGELDKKIVNAAFQMFTDEKPTFLINPPSIILGPANEKRCLTKDNFSGFTELVREACAMIDLKRESIEFLETDTPRVRELKEKLLKGRRDRAAAKARDHKKSEEGEIELSDLIGSLAIGSNAYNMTNIWNLTYYAFHDQLKRMNWREEFDINTRASLAGAKLNKEKLTHWIKSMTFN